MKPDLQDREDVVVLVSAFYTRAFADPLIGPIFTDVAHMDLAAHMPVMCDFWETVLFQAGLYQRNALALHLALDQKRALEQPHFDRWLELWVATVDDHYAGEAAERAKEQAERIAGSIQRRLQGGTGSAFETLEVAHRYPWAMNLSALRRWPDVEADNLFAVDASDRLILAEAESALRGSAAGEVVVIGDRYGALTLGALDIIGRPESDAAGIRVHQDALSGELALAANAAALGMDSGYHSIALGIEQHPGELLGGARVVLLQLPRSLDALDEIAAAIARHADPDVVVFAGGRIKHMTPTMNTVLGEHFGRVDVSLAQQKSRVLRASAPQQAATAPWPRMNRHDDLKLIVAAHGAAFAGASVDIGTRFLLGHLAEAKPGARSAIDLGCGTGILATALALHRPELRVLATDQSAAAVASARATAAVNGVSERVIVVRDDGLSAQPDASAELIVLNPPFHVGATVHAGIALKLFEHAARVLAPGGQLWCVWNSHLGYGPALRDIVGPTRQIARNAKFTITASTRAS